MAGKESLGQKGPGVKSCSFTMMLPRVPFSHSSIFFSFFSPPSLAKSDYCWSRRSIESLLIVISGHTITFSLCPPPHPAPSHTHTHFFLLFFLWSFVSLSLHIFIISFSGNTQRKDLPPSLPLLPENFTSIFMFSSRIPTHHHLFSFIPP